MDDANVISEYSLEQAIEDGVLVEVFSYNIKDFVEKYTNGKPVVATAHLFNQVSETDLTDLWNKYVDWRNGGGDMWTRFASVNFANWHMNQRK